MAIKSSIVINLAVIMVTADIHTYIQGVSGGIVNILEGGSMEYSD
jgi:hypothetical protein